MGVGLNHPPDVREDPGDTLEGGDGKGREGREKKESEERKETHTLRL